MSGSTWNWIGGNIDLESPSDWTLTHGPADGTIPQTGDTATNSGTLVGLGVIAASIINSGTIEASNNAVGSSSTGGEMTIQGSVSGTGTMTIEPGATLQIDGVLGAGQSIVFSPGAPETLILGSPAAITTNTITGFALGDQIEFSNGVTITGSPIVSGGTTSIPYQNPDGTTGTYQFTNLGYAAGTAHSFEHGFDFATGAQNIEVTRFFTWTGASNTSFGVASNWNDTTDGHNPSAVTPGAPDFVIFSSGGTIGGTGTAFVMDFRGSGSWTLAAGTALSDTESVQLGHNGTGSLNLSVGNTTTISSAGFITVATSAGNEDLLSITAGGVVRQTGPGVTYTHAMSIGTGGASGTLAASDGVVLVSGTGSLLDLGANGLTVANNGGTGVLTVQQGGTVDAATANTSLSASVSIANSGGNGSVLVTGIGSVLNATGYFLDGRGGTGSLTITSGGLVTVTDSALNGSGVGIGAGRGAGPSSAANLGGDGVATVTGGGELDLNSTVSGIVVGGEGSSGILNVNSGGTVLTGTGITIGTATTANGTIYGGSGALNIGAGGLVKVGIAAQSVNYSVTVGGGNSLLNGVPTGLASGEADISGAGAELNTNGNPLAIGYLSNGSMVVSQGGSVVSGSPNDLAISALSVGRLGNGSLTVSDQGTGFTVNGGAYIGRGGTGDLNVENHATMDVMLDGNGDSYLDIGNAGLLNGNTLLTGGSGSALVTSDGVLFSEKTVTVGQAGDSGNLTITNGGTVEAAETLQIGNTVTLAAGGTEITPSGTTTVAGATPFTGNGVIDVGAGGVLKADGGGITTAGTSDIVVGEAAGSSGALNVTGAGATVNSEGYRIAVGSSGSGSLLVSQGATVLAGTKFASDEAIYAGGTGGTGAVTVSDPGSKLTAVGQFAVGLDGQGSLLIENQGTVATGGNTVDTTEGFDIGQDTGASGTATVTGTKSLLTNTGRFIVGDAGLGSLSIASGGTVTTSAGATIANTVSASGSSVNVSGAGSKWQVTGALTVGAAGFGQLSIAQGATVTGAALTEGAAAGGSGVVSVAGTGSALNLTGVLNIGGLAPGQLSIETSGEVTAASVTIGAGAGGAGEIVIGAGSTLKLTGTAAPVVVGTGTVAALLNIQGGTLMLSGSPTYGADGRLVQVGGLIDPAPTLIVAGNAFGGGAVDEASVEVLNTATTISKAPDISAGSATFLAPLVTGGTASKPGIWNIDTGGTLVLNVNSVVATQEFSFADNTGVLEIGQQVTLDGSGTPGTINEATLAGFQGSIDSYVTGDQIIVDTTAAAGFAYIGGGTTITVNDLVGGTPTGAQEGALVFTDAGAAAQAFADLTNATPSLVDQVLPCFAAGTRIETEMGPVAVEDLRAGDRVVTADGDGGTEAAPAPAAGDRQVANARPGEPIIWIGQRAVNCARHPKPETVWPVRVRAGAFGENVPACDVYLSPDHAVFVNGVLVPVKLLTNGTSIAQVKRARVTYYHVELPRHAVILAEGLPVESYLDTGDRANFANGGGPVALHPNFSVHVWEAMGCAPLVVTGQKLAAIRRRLEDRARPARQKARNGPGAALKKAATVKPASSLLSRRHGTNTDGLD